ncbi:unknown [Acidaminococcus sp. CAG:542]|nr:unknown [Acidaminococcus sp. CAG:542]
MMFPLTSFCSDLVAVSVTVLDPPLPFFTRLVKPSAFWLLLEKLPLAVSVILVVSSETVCTLFRDLVVLPSPSTSFREVFTLPASWLRVLVLVPSVTMFISLEAVLVEVLLLAPSTTDSLIWLVVMVRLTLSPTLSVMDLEAVFSISAAELLSFSAAVLVMFLALLLKVSEAVLVMFLASLAIVPFLAVLVISFAVWVTPVMLVPSVTALPMNGLAASSRFLITSMKLPPLTRASSILVAVLDVALYWVSLALISCSDLSTVLLLLLTLAPSVMEEARLPAFWFTTVVLVPSVTEEATWSAFCRLLEVLVPSVMLVLVWPATVSIVVFLSPSVS